MPSRLVSESHGRSGQLMMLHLACSNCCVGCLSRCGTTSPTKPIGPVYSASTAQRLALERGWSVAPDGDGWRRVVASPEPQRGFGRENLGDLAAYLVLANEEPGVDLSIGIEAAIRADLVKRQLCRIATQRLGRRRERDIGQSPILVFS